MADEALARAQRSGDLRARTVAHRAHAVAARERHDIAAARTSAEAAVRVASNAGLTALQGVALLTLSSVHLAAGAIDEALAALTLAEPLIETADLANLRLQQATALQRSDRLDEALVAFEAAISAARSTGDRLAEAMALVNRGILHTYADRFGAADRDLARAETMFLDLDFELAVADVRHNRGFVAAATGDLAVALQRYGDARQTYERLEVQRPNALLDEAATLAEAHLVTDAINAASLAANQLRQAGELAHLAEALLFVADLLRQTGRSAEARAAGSEARRLLVEQGRVHWIVLADAVMAQVDDDVRPPAVRRLAHELTAAGWIEAGLQARLRAGLLAEQAGDVGSARADYDAVAGHRRRGPAERRILAWHALARRRLLDGDAAGASRAAQAGVRVAHRGAAALAATDVRSRAAVGVEPLLDIGMGAALRARRPERVLAWAELWRARGLTHVPLRSPALPELVELRSTMRRLADPATPSYLRGELDQRRHRLEAAADRQLRASPTAPTRHAAAFDIDLLKAQLAGGTLVEFVAHDGLLHRVVVHREDVRLLSQRSLDDVMREVRALRLAASRAAIPGSPERHEHLVMAAASRLDALLLEDVDLEDDVVLVPTGALHSLPWAFLPSLAIRHFTVAPSAALWASTPPPNMPDDPRAVVVAVGVDFGEVEAAAVAAAYAAPVVLCGSDATVSAVLTALRGADVAHIAAHATFRSDNPQYSALHLADGPLFVHDLDGLGHAPPIVVLSACGAALFAVAEGDELLGLSAGFIRAGTSTLVASTLPVADDRAPTVMATLHRLLRSVGPTAALPEALGPSPIARGVAFTCYGRG